ncbi:MAG: N-acetyl-gamma-glutamyl-phosphate reductase [Nitriliruptoraceae bacterium]
MAVQVGIVGASGYGGAELVRLLSAHPEFDVAVVAAHGQAGTPVADLYPNLVDFGSFDGVNVDALADLDLVFLATPHGPAAELGSALFDANVRTIDLSAAFRLDADRFSQWYGEEHSRPDLLATDDSVHGAAVYGITEFARSAVASATLVANPGCYVITALLGLVPVASLFEPASLVVDGKSGTSGAGRAAKDALHFSHVDSNLTAYGAPGHRHTGELERYLGHLGDYHQPVTFIPHLVPMARGLLITATATLRDDIDGDAVQQALVDAYRDAPFVHVLEPGRFPSTKAVAGSNGCQVSAVVDPRTQRVIVTSVTDNLGKGAAGGAVQNANVLFGLPETTGLTAIGIYP